MTTQDSSPSAPLSGSMMPETLSALRDLIAETDELQKAAGGSVTARALDWLLPQSAVAARKQVSAAATPIAEGSPKPIAPRPELLIHRRGRSNL